MANALQTRPQGTAVAATQAYDPFTRAGSMDSSGSGQYLKFNGKTGEYTFGQNAEEMPEGSHLACDMNQAKWGWICWVDGEVKEERMKRVIDGDPDPEESLTDYGPYTKHDDGTEDGWAKQRLLHFRDPVSGEEYIYKTVSGSGVRAFGSLMKDYGRNYKQYPGMIPLVALGVGSFVPKNNKRVGKVYTPEFKIVDWKTEEELLAQVGEADDGAEYEGEGAAEGAAEGDYIEGGEYVEGTEGAEGGAYQGEETAGDYQDDGVIEGTAEDVTEQQPEPEPEPAPARQPARAAAPAQRPAAPAAQARPAAPAARPAAPAPAARPAAPAQRPAAPAAQARPAAPAAPAAQRQPPQMQPRPAAPAPAPQGAGGPARQRRF